MFSNNFGQMNDFYIDDCIKVSVSFLKGKGIFQGNTHGVISWGKSSLSFYYHDEQLTFSYNYKGENRSQRFSIVSRPTNLGKGSRLFFECPETGRLCSKVYVTPTGKILTRFMMKGVRYSEQDDSRYWRDLNSLKRYDEDPRRKNGKFYYKGKLTRYGQRVIKCDEKYNKYGELWFQRIMKRHSK